MQVDILALIIACVGTWIVADGVASLWAYLPKADETFWRNHALRLLRCLLGFILIGLGVILIYEN